MARSTRPPNSDVEASGIERALRDGTEADVAKALARVGRSRSPLARALDGLEDGARREKEESGARLHRMRENVRQNKCQACKVAFSDDAAYVVNCCQIVLCSFCASPRAAAAAASSAGAPTARRPSTPGGT